MRRRSQDSNVALPALRVLRSKCCSLSSSRAIACRGHLSMCSVSRWRSPLAHRFERVVIHPSSTCLLHGMLGGSLPVVLSASRGRLHYRPIALHTHMHAGRRSSARASWQGEAYGHLRRNTDTSSVICVAEQFSPLAPCMTPAQHTTISDSGHAFPRTMGRHSIFATHGACKRLKPRGGAGRQLSRQKRGGHGANSESCVRATAYRLAPLWWSRAHPWFYPGLCCEAAPEQR